MENVTTAQSTALSQTSKYDQTILTKNFNGEIVTDILFSGLNVKLSDLTGLFPAAVPGNTLTIYADTVLVDIPDFNCAGIVIVARQIDITSLDNASWPISVPATAVPAVLECLIMSSISNGTAAPLSFITSITPGAAPAPLFTAPTNQPTLAIGEFLVNTDGTTSSEVLTDANDFLDLIGRPYALNSFYAGFTYATDLINLNDTASIGTAFSILNWICDTIISCGSIPSTHAELYAQASSLLVSLNIPVGYQYLGVLSPDFYSTQISNLIDIVAAYDDHLNQLEQQSTVVGIVDSISAAMVATAGTESAPTQLEISQVNSSLNSLYAQINTLNNQIAGQIVVADGNFNSLNIEIAQDQIQNFLKDSIKTAIDAMGAMIAIGGAIDKAGEGAGEALSATTTVVTDAIDTISGITATYETGDLVNTAKTLITQNQQLLNNVYTSQQLWYQINGGSAGTINFSPEPITMDPNVAWDNFMVQVDNVLSNLTNAFGSQDFSSAQEQSNDYLASLKELTNYGKAFNAQVIAYSNQLCQGVVLLAKQEAINGIEAIWNNLKQESATEQEKITSLEGLILNRVDATMRSLFLAWTSYRSAYMYNNLSEPTAVISMESSLTDLKVAFANIQSWVAGMPVGGQGTTRLPNDNATITLSIPVLDPTTNKVPGSAAESNPAGLLAYITPSPTDPNFAATVTLSLPKILNQFSAQIGNGDVAIWITNGQFIMNGAGANSSGYIPMTISTSGQYINGYESDLLCFLSNAVSSHFSYRPGVNGGNPVVNVPWAINAQVYMMPTPYTIWTFQINKGCDISGLTSLNITLTVNLQFQN